MSAICQDNGRLSGCQVYFYHKRCAARLSVETRAKISYNGPRRKPPGAASRETCEGDIESMTLIDYLKKIKGVRLLPPRDKEFYVLFNELTSTIVESSELLILLFESFIADRAEVEGQISNALPRCNRIAESIR